MNIQMSEWQVRLALCRYLKDHYHVEAKPGDLSVNLKIKENCSAKGRVLYRNPVFEGVSFSLVTK